MTRKQSSIVPMLIVIGILVMVSQCGDDGPEHTPRVDPPTPPPPRDTSPYRPEIDESPGAAIAILIDTSGSMKDPAAGDSKPKHVVARAAVAEMLDVTDAFLAKHPDYPVKVAVLHFADRVVTDLPVQPYDREKVRAALENLPEPGGKTAIGAGLEQAVAELYRSGAFRKYILVVTDGENTTGIEPRPMAEEIHQRSEQSVPMYFVAFDTDPAKFGFLSSVGGEVVSARGAAELEEVLKSVYEGRILAEALPEED